MKKFKIIPLFIAFILFSSCSVQEKMSPEIFVERLSKEYLLINSDSFNDFLSDNKYFCFLTNKNNTEFLIELNINDSNDITKIGLACTQVDKEKDFINLVESILNVYSKNASSKEIINNLFENGKLKKQITYYDTQWHLFTASADKNGLYFSITNKKLNPWEESLLSLKSNDRITF